jgi:hypothetical protein
MKTGGADAMLTIQVPRKRVTITLALIVTAMAGASVIAQWVKHVTTSEHVAAVARIFKLSAEDTIPAYLSALLLLAAAGMFWLISRCAAASVEPFVRHWRGLAFIFTYMSIDEAVGIHELAIEPMRKLLGAHATGVLHYAWVVPGAILVLVVGLTYLRFVFSMRAPIRNRLILAAGLYVGAALGLEMVGGIIAAARGTSNLAYALIAWLEECGEMFGVVVLIDALLIQLATYGEICASVIDGYDDASQGAPIDASHFEGSSQDGSSSVQRGITRASRLVRDATWNGARSNPTLPQP